MPPLFASAAHSDKSEKKMQCLRSGSDCDSCILLAKLSCLKALGRLYDLLSAAREQRQLPRHLAPIFTRTKKQMAHCSQPSLITDAGVLENGRDIVGGPQ